MLDTKVNARANSKNAQTLEKEIKEYLNSFRKY